MSKKKSTLYCNPDPKNFNWEKPVDLKNLPRLLSKYSRVKVTFEKYVPKKSMKQLGYYFGGIVPFLKKELSDETGLTADQWHDELKNRFGIREVSGCGRFQYIKSVSTYSEPQMAAYITDCLGWIYEFLGVNVPPKATINEYL